MEIVQVLIFMVIIAIAIVQQITKAKKETGTPSPREVLTDMFPTIEETEEEEQTISPRPIKCAPRPIRKRKKSPYQHQLPTRIPDILLPMKKTHRAKHTRRSTTGLYLLGNFQSKILITTILTTRKHIEYHGI